MHAPPPNAPSLVGRVFGNQFRLEALLGRGGMGEVYVAEQLGLGRRVVLKLLLSTSWSSPELEERFRREARVLAQLNHPNIVQLYSFGRSDDGITYLAMEYIDGHTLSSVIRERGELPEGFVREVLVQICSALIHAHSHGIVHRDLKPDNVMIIERPGQSALVKVLDFGIAKLTHATHDPRLTKTGAILGTPQYMAPEQIREAAIDARTDIYGLGLLGYELLTGHLPFDAENTMELMLRVVSDEAPPPSRQGGRLVSPAIEALIMRCLAKAPAERFQTASELQGALAAIPRGESALPPAAAGRPTADASAPPMAAGPLQADRVSLPSLTLDALDAGHAHVTSIRPRAARNLAAIVAVFALFGGMASAIYYLATLEPAPTQPGEVAPAADDGTLLPLREWVQGIPFPEGTEYDRFGPSFVDAHVAAPANTVIAFYRHYASEKWGALKDADSGLIVDNPDAPIENLTVTPYRNGSRLLIKRRSAK